MLSSADNVKKIEMMGCYTKLKFFHCNYVLASERGEIKFHFSS